MSTSTATAILISSATLAANGTTLTVNLSGATGTLAPASPTGWFVFVNGIPNIVTAASMNTANGVNTLTLAEPVRAGQVVRLRYDFTSVGGTQITDSGSPTDSLIYYDGYVVTNNSTVTSNLTLTSPAVSTSGLAVTFTVSGSTGTINLATALSAGYTPYGFRIIVGTNAAVVPVTAVGISGTTLTLTLQSPIPSGVTVNYLYSYKGGAQVWDSAGTINSLGEVNAQTAVTNNSTLTARFFADTFNATNGSNLTAHTPDTGTSWTASAGVTWTISNGAQTGTSTTLFTHNPTFPGVATNVMQIGPAPSTNNYRVTTDLYLRTKANENVSVYLRASATASSGYQAIFNPNGAGSLTINKLGGGSFPSGTTTTANLAGYTFTAAQTYTLAFEVFDGFVHDSRGGSSVGSYTVNNAGSGYTGTPSLAYTFGPTLGSGATGTITKSANTIGSVAPATGDTTGSGMWTAPGVTVTGGSGSGATLTANLVQGRPCVIIQVYLILGSQQALGAPLLTIIDTYSPITTAGNICLTAVNDGPSNGVWFANFKVDYGCTGTIPIHPQGQYIQSWSDSAYPYSTVNVTPCCQPALDGVPPYSYALYRNTTRSTSGATLVSSLGSSPASLAVADTPAYRQAGPYWYYYIVTDALGATAQTFQQAAGGAAELQFAQFSRDTPLNIYFAGDSETTSGLFFPTVYGVLGRFLAPRTVNGVLEGITTNLAASSYIQGQSGSLTSGWVKGQAFYNTMVTNLISLKCTAVSIMLGANDARDGQSYNSFVPPATYGANLSNIANNLLVDAGAGAGGALVKVILQYPYPAVYGSNANGNVWQSDSIDRFADYRAQIDALVNGTTIFAGDNGLSQFFTFNTQLLSDGVHPAAPVVVGSFNGQNWMGFCWGQAIARALFPTTNTQTTGSIPSVRSGVSN